MAGRTVQRPLFGIARRHQPDMPFNGARNPESPTRRGSTGRTVALVRSRNRHPTSSPREIPSRAPRTCHVIDRKALESHLFADLPEGDGTGTLRDHAVAFRMDQIRNHLSSVVGLLHYRPVSSVSGTIRPLTSPRPPRLVANHPRSGNRSASWKSLRSDPPDGFRAVIPPHHKMRRLLHHESSFRWYHPVGLDRIPSEWSTVDIRCLSFRQFSLCQITPKDWNYTQQQIKQLILILSSGSLRFARLRAYASFRFAQLASLFHLSSERDIRGRTR